MSDHHFLDNMFLEELSNDGFKTPERYTKRLKCLFGIHEYEWSTTVNTDALDVYDGWVTYKLPKCKRCGKLLWSAATKHEGE
jgi:hypothetical protein